MSVGWRRSVGGSFVSGIVGLTWGAWGAECRRVSWRAWRAECRWDGSVTSWLAERFRVQSVVLFCGVGLYDVV